MAELLKPTDTLAQGYPKINAAIGQAEQSLTISDNAMDTANSSIAVSNQALANSQSTQDQLNQVVIEGDSSVEAAQARINADNTVTYGTLKERLDTENQGLSSQLASIENKKVDKVTGKGLSTNDYTNADKLEVAKVVNKADKTYVDTVTTSLASGSPKATFATLPALQSDATANTVDGKKSIYVVTADGKWYFWNGTAWTSGGTYQSTGIANSSVEKRHLAFYTVEGEPSVNLFDKSTSLPDRYVTPGSGNVATSTGFTLSDYISVKPNTAYIVSSSIWRLTLFDANKQYISNTDVDIRNITTTAATAYIRVTIKAPLSNADTFMLCEGTALPATYVKYGNTYKDKSISARHLDDSLREQIEREHMSFEILLPKDIYLISGESFSIYYKYIINYAQAFEKGNYYIVVLEKTGETTYLNRGLTYDYKWEYTPANTDIIFDMEFRIVSTYDEQILASKVVTFHVANSSNVSNHNRDGSIITIGDSFVDGYHIVDKLHNNLTTKSGVNNPTFLGKNTSPGSTIPHDAHGGWNYNSFITGSTNNPFYNSATSTFDFSYYMSQHYPTYKPASSGNPRVGTVLLMCGLNDAGWRTVDNYGIHLDLMITNINKIITSIHAFDPAIKVFVYTIVPQTPDQNQIGTIFTTFAHHERINYVLAMINKRIIDTFDTTAMKSANVHVLPSAANFDYRFGMGSADTFKPNKFDQTYTESHVVNIHPSDTGAEYIADTLYQAIYNLGFD